MPRSPHRWDGYRSVVFDLSPESVLPPGLLGIVTAWNPGVGQEDGRVLSRSDNEARDARLCRRLKGAGLHHVRIVGRSPSGDHAEASWLVAAPPPVIVELGRAFGQDAVYLVDPAADTLFLAPCDGGPPEELGSFRGRIRPPRRGGGGVIPPEGR
jgi:hypothetical protein